MPMSQLMNIAMGELDPETIPDLDIAEVFDDATGETLTRTGAARVMLYLATTSGGFAQAVPPETFAQMRAGVERYLINRAVEIMESRLDESAIDGAAGGV